MKFPGIPEELEATVELLVADAATKAVAAAKLEADKEVAALKAQLAAKDELILEAATDAKEPDADDEGDSSGKAKNKNAASAETLVPSIKALKAKLAAAGTELTAAKSTLAEKTAALGEIESAKAVEATWLKIVAEYSIPDDPKVKEKLMPIVAKIAANAVVSIEEFKQIHAAAGKTPPAAAPKAGSRLYAGSGVDEDAVLTEPQAADKEALGKNFPVLKAGVRYR